MEQGGGDTVHLATPLSQVVAEVRDGFEAGQIAGACTAVGEAVLGPRAVAMLTPEFDLLASGLYIVAQWAAGTMGAAVVDVSPVVVSHGVAHVDPASRVAAHRRHSVALLLLALWRYGRRRWGGDASTPVINWRALAAGMGAEDDATLANPGRPRPARLAWLWMAALWRRVATMVRSMRHHPLVDAMVHVYGPVLRWLWSPPVATLLAEAYTAQCYFTCMPLNPWASVLGLRLVTGTPPTSEDATWWRWFQVMGVVLMVQSVLRAVRAAVTAIHALWVEAQGDEGAGGRGRLAGGGVGGHAGGMLYDYDGEEEEEESRAEVRDRVEGAPSSSSSTGAAVQPSNHRGKGTCGVCLQAWRHTAATPCGHVFCWRCAVRATMTKPECPVCRQPCMPQQIVPLFNL